VGGIYEVHQCDTYSKFCDDQFRHSSNMKVINQNNLRIHSVVITDRRDL
jgi:hypothetical protein